MMTTILTAATARLPHIWILDETIETNSDTNPLTKYITARSATPGPFKEEVM